MHFQHATDAFTLKNGVKIPCIGFGTWQSADGPTAENAVREAIEAGYRHIDTAAIYHNERSVGRGIKDSGINHLNVFSVKCIKTYSWFRFSYFIYNN